MSLFIFQGFSLCSAVRFAHRAASEAGLVRERLQTLKPVGGKPSSIYGNKSSLFRFLSGRQKGTSPFVSPAKSQFAQLIRKALKILCAEETYPASAVGL